MFAPVLSWIGKGFSKLVELMNGAGVVWVFALMFLIVADITGRTLFDTPIEGVPEMVSLSLVACVFLQIAAAVHRRRLTRASVLIDRLEQARPVLANDWALFVAAIGVLMFAVIAVGTWPELVRAIRTSEFAGVEGVYTIPIWPIKLLLAFGAVVAAAAFAGQLGGSLIHMIQLGARGADAEERRGRRAFWLLPLALIATVAALWHYGASDQMLGISMIVIVLVLIAMGTPIALALLLTGFLGIGLIKRDFSIATKTLALAAEGTVSDYVFATVPLFVLMGLFVNVSDIGRDAFGAAQKLFGRFRGGLGVATVAANAIFAAITGISIASAAIFTKIAVPEMVRQGYTARFAVGLTAGSSVLGMLIPPSLLLIVYGIIAEVSIGGLFVAAVLPGILLAAAFALGVVLMARFWPGFVGAAEGSVEVAAASDRHALIAVLPVFVLIALVLGGIYGGVFTPTEAGAAGAFAAMCLALARRRLGWSSLWRVILETGQVSVTILFLIISASTFSRMLTLTGLPQSTAAVLSDTSLGLGGFLAGHLALLILLGMVLDSTSILLILLPLVLPVATALGANLIWFGIVTVIGVEIGLLTPPLGLSVYVIKSSLDDERITLGTIFAGAFPFVLITLAVTIAVMVFPSLALVFL